MVVPPNSATRECNRCKTVKPFILTGKKRNGASSRLVYSDDTGKRWRGAICPPCCKPIRKVSNARRPKNPIDLCETPYVKRGRKSEQRVKIYIEAQGFKTQITDCKGPDVRIIHLNGAITTIEVKTVSRMKGSSQLYVSDVSPQRIEDDYIAFVFPDDRIYIEPMCDHLKSCPSNGKRGITEIYWRMVEDGLEVRFIR